MSSIKCPNCGKYFKEKTEDKVGRYAVNTVGILAGIGTAFFNEHLGHIVAHGIHSAIKCPYCGKEIKD